MIELETPLTNTFHRIRLPLLPNTRHLEVALILRNARTIGKFILDEKGFKLSIIFNISQMYNNNRRIEMPDGNER